MIAGVPKETFPGERRVALSPAGASALVKAGIEILIEKGAGGRAGYADGAYEEKEARITGDRTELYARSELILQVRGPGANPVEGAPEIELLRPDQTLIALLDPLAETETMRRLARTGANIFAMELIPRITRAQGMDVLSSMATVAGYMAVLIGATRLPKFFPMFMTAAGTISAAKVLVVGAGVAGLQAIATARRLGAIVEAYDVRPAVKEQIESLGARFVELPIETGGAEDAGGYAREQTEEEKQRQRELMAEHVRMADVVITTAAVPGKKSPILIAESVVEGMLPGSVIVDIAAEKGGNCALTVPGETIERHGVTIAGPLNLPSTLPTHASQMYSKNLVTFIQHLAPGGSLRIDMDDEITGRTLAAREGKVVHPSVREAMGGEETP